MSNYTNDSYTTEKYYDLLHERSEDAKSNPCRCDNGKVYYSSCCGDFVEDGICNDCEQPCMEIEEDCEECNGTGEI